VAGGQQPFERAAFPQRKGAAYIEATRIHVECRLRRRIAHADRGVARDRDPEQVSGVARDDRGLVEASFAPARGMQRHRDQQGRQLIAAITRHLRQQHAEHARMCDGALVLEPADQFVDRVFIAERDHGLAGMPRPRQVRVAHHAQVEIRRRARESTQRAARRKQGGRDEPGPGPWRRQPEVAQSVDNGVAGPEHAPSFDGPPLGHQPEISCRSIDKGAR